jgi:hypothetical protein
MIGACLRVAVLVAAAALALEARQAIFRLPTQSCSPSPCITSTSGTLSTGTTVTITGLGFGSHADYGGSLTTLAAAWTRWQDVSCAQAFGTITGANTSGGWRLVNTGSGWQNFAFTTSGGRTNGTCHVRKTGNVSRQGEISHDKITTDTGKGSARFWFLNTGPADVAQGKMFRTWADNGDWWISTWGINNALGGDRGTCTGCGARITWDQDEAASPIANSTLAWNLVEVYWCDDAGCGASDPTPDNYMVVYVNSVLAFENGQSVNSSQWIPAAAGDVGHTIDLAELIEQDGSEWGYDDALYDKTWAGVAMCAGSTWAARGECEWMAPLSWSSTSLTVEWNNGVNSSASGRYLYVMDEHLVPTSGYLIP